MNSNDVLQLIKERKSTRFTFDKTRVIEPEVMHKILEAATCAPTGHNMQNYELVVIDDPAVLSAIGELDIPYSPAFVKWNYQEVSFSEDELRKKKTGMMASQFPPSWFTPEAREGKLKESAGKMSAMLEQVPVVLLVVWNPNREEPTTNGNFNGIMSLGFMLENLWLMANAQGVGVRIVSAFAGEPMESKVKEMLSIPSSLKIAIGCFLGYTDGEENNNFRVCRDVDNFVYLNGYGKDSNK